MREELDKANSKMNKKLYFILELSYSAILHLESHCSTIPNIFAIVAF